MRKCCCDCHDRMPTTWERGWATGYPYTIYINTSINGGPLTKEFEQQVTDGMHLTICQRVGVKFTPDGPPARLVP